MRKFWYAGAVVAGGVFLLGATPAQAADPQPGSPDVQQGGLLSGAAGAKQQVDDALGYSLNKTNGIKVSTTDPLGPGAPVNLQPGTNSANLTETDLTKMLTDSAPAGAHDPADESVLAGGPDLPAADVVGDALPRSAGSLGDLPLKHLPMGAVTRHLLPAGLLGGGLFDGLTPSGQTAAFDDQPTARQAELFDGGMPLLGGLGGVLPPNSLPRNPVGGYLPSTTGLPAGGMTVAPAAGALPAKAPKQAARPATVPATAAAAADPRLHEEPIDGEASRRAFSADGRPVAGFDPQYK
jgi:hypothetical protein